MNLKQIIESLKTLKQKFVKKLNFKIYALITHIWDSKQL